MSAKSVKVLHLSDLHLGTENYGRLDPATGLNSRLLDFTGALDRAIDGALEAEVDLVVFSGDAYRSRDPSPTHQREFARRIHRLASEGVSVFLLVGNHDLPLQLGKANSMDIFETLAVPNVHIGRRPGLHLIETRSGVVQVVALPWLMRSALLAKDEFKNRTIDELNTLIAEKLSRIVADQVEHLDPELPAILCAHISVMGAVYGSERSIMLGQDFAVPKSTLAHPAFDYIALGHIHKHQVLNTHPLMIYPGSIERVDFGEERDDKGFVLVDLAKGDSQYRFLRLPARRFLTIEVKAEGEDPLGQVLAAIERHDLTDAVVRVVIHTTTDKEAQVSYTEVRKALKDAHYVAAITKKVEREERHRVGGALAEAMSPEDALRVYLRLREVPEERREKLIQYAKGLLESVT